MWPFRQAEWLGSVCFPSGGTAVNRKKKVQDRRFASMTWQSVRQLLKAFLFPAKPCRPGWKAGMSPTQLPGLHSLCLLTSKPFLCYCSLVATYLCSLAWLISTAKKPQPSYALKGKREWGQRPDVGTGLSASPGGAGKHSLHWTLRPQPETVPNFADTDGAKFDSDLCFLAASQVLWKPPQATVALQEEMVLVHALASPVQQHRHGTQLNISRDLDMEGAALTFPGKVNISQSDPEVRGNLGKGNHILACFVPGET